jgi:hypothetical protein
MPANRPSLKTERPVAILTIPELEHAKAAARYSRLIAFSRAYKPFFDPPRKTLPREVGNFG